LPAEPSPATAPPIARSQSAAPPAKAAPNPAPVNPPPAPSPVAPTLSYDAMIKKASSMATAQQYDQAQSLLNSAIQSDPSNWKAYSELGKIELYNLNQPDAAFGHFRKALDYGGEVTFRVALEHGLSGSLTLSKTHGSIIDGADVHNFALTDVQEAKRSKLGLLKVGKGRHSFSIHLTSGDNYNLEPTSKSAEQEVSFILSILRS
jgi:tetratricopeptide (TPR) repeat protein